MDDRLNTDISVPKTVFWALLVPAISAIIIGSGVTAVLFSTVSLQGVWQNKADQRITAIEAKIDANKENGGEIVSGIRERLIRIEAQLSYLVGNTGAGKK